MGPPTCSAKADHATKISVLWMTGLETAADILGAKVRLAAVLDIDPRSLRNKLDAGRGISRADVITTAAALKALAVRATTHAAKLRAAAPPFPAITAGATA